MIDKIFATIIKGIDSIDITCDILLFGCFNRNTYKESKEGKENKGSKENIYDIFSNIENTY